MRSSAVYGLRVLACILIILVGMGIASALVKMRKPPVQLAVEERAVRVTVQEVRLENIPVTITGYGQARPRDIVSISSEVSGTVVDMNPRLEIGEVIPKGELLFRIDPRDYQARYDDSLATVNQLENTVARLQKQESIDRERLQTFDRTRDLSKREYDRVKELYAKSQVGTQSNVDNAEMAFNNANDLADQLTQQLDLMPLRIQEAESSLHSASALSGLAKANLERTSVIAPFDARIADVSIERGQFLGAGATVLTLADDSMLEISVSLNSREARNWLRFDESTTLDENAWFNALKHVPVQISWTEHLDETGWTGQLARVQRFDQETRTLSVIVRVKGANAKSPQQGGLPLVDGMFCRVLIPGREAQNVVRLPAECVAFDRDASGYRTAYVAERNAETKETRLVSRRVKESHIGGDSIFISEGLKAGDWVITTRLVNPLESSLLDVTQQGAMETGS